MDPNDQTPDDQVDDVSARDMFPENTITDSIFGDGDVIKYEELRKDKKGDAPGKKPEPSSKKTEDPPVKKDDDAPDDSHEDDDAEIDWEDDAGLKKTDDAADDDDDASLKDETIARQQAKLRGRELKKTKLELEEIRLEKERIEREAAEWKSKVEEYEASTLDPTEHPDFKAMRREILTDVENAAELMPVSDPALVVNNFGQFMLSYLSLEGLSGKERAEKLSALKGQIVDAVAAPDIPYGEMTAEEQAEFNTLTGEVLRLVQRNARPTKSLYELKDALESKAKSGVLLKGVREYEAAVNEFKPVMDVIGDLPDEVIDSDPHNPAVVVAKMIRENPASKKLVETAKRDVLEMITGPRPLTLDEIKRLEANGTNVKQFLAERETKFRAKQKKLLPILVQGLLTRSTLKSSLAELDTLRKSKSAEDGEFDVLSSIGRKKAPAPKEPEKPKVSAIDRLFDDD